MTTATHKTIVTFWEEHGAGATTIAPRVAEKLGVPYLSQALSSVQIEEAEASADHPHSLIGRLLAAVTPLPEPDVEITWATDARSDDEVVTDNRRLVSDFVADGGVILGRNSTVILRDAPGALHVKVIGPVEQRVARSAAEAGVSLEQAAKRQVREDRVRAEVAMRLFNWDPHDEVHYDLVVNTGRIGLDAAADLIVAAYRAVAAAR